MENQTFTADLITNIYFNQTFHVDLSTSFMGNTMTTPATEKETSHPGPATLRLALAIPLLIMATVGNSLAFAVMRRRSMRNTSPGVYFAAIACANTVTVYWGAVPFLIFYFTSIDLWSYHPWSCRVVIFTLFTSADSAVWLLVAVTVDRFIAVKFPLVRKQMCTPKRAFIVACVLPSIASIKNLHLFFTRGRQVIVDAALPEEEWAVSNCGFLTPEIEFFETYIRSWIAFSLYAVVPIVSVFILNVLIIRTLYTSRKVTTVTAAGEAKPSAREERAGKSNYQLTVMFLSVSITFLILITPSITVLVIKAYLNLTKSGAARYAYVETIMDSMAYLMHSSNFFLYCLTGAGFRRELKLMVSRWMGNSNIEDLMTTECTAAFN